jgi:uncharacterized protein (TIGR01777 family)
MLLQQGHTVINLTTQKTLPAIASNGSVNSYWNPAKNEIDINQLNEIDAVINLAGYSVANKWTEANKEKMVRSRIDSTRTLVAALKKNGITPGVFISASAAGYYQASDAPMEENDQAGTDFLATLTKDWEAELEPLTHTAARLVIIRISVVLDASEGALGKMIPFFKFGLGSAVGHGNQLVSWIHLDDLCGFILHAISAAEVQGVYNMAAPQVLTNKMFSAAIAKALHKPFFLPNIPAFVINLMFGPMAALVLQSRNLTSQRLSNSGYTIQYSNIDKALSHIFAKK